MVARYLGSAVAAVIVTALLFLLMYYLLESGENALKKAEGPGKIIINTEKEDDDVIKNQRDQVEKPKLDDQPPPPDFSQPTARNTPNTIRGSFNTGAVDVNLNFDASMSDRDAQPIVRIPAQYPRRAQERGIEGYVIVRFNVDETGSPYDIVVLESSSSLFERSASRAVEKWKYQPKIVNGKPVHRRGVETKITFELTD